MSVRHLTNHDRLMVSLPVVFLVAVLIGLWFGRSQFLVCAVIVLFVLLSISKVFGAAKIPSEGLLPRSNHVHLDLRRTMYLAVLSASAGIVASIELEFLGPFAIIVVISVSILTYVLVLTNFCLRI